MTFEQNPILLIVAVVVIVEAWNLTKVGIRSLIERRKMTTREPS
jgi:hypothetical protein